MSLLSIFETLFGPKCTDVNSLQYPLLVWRRAHTWTLGDAFEGTLIVGATGSGKTSGSGETIARSFLSNGFSGLVLCVKPTDPSDWIKMAREEGRSNDLVLFSPGSGFCFNPLGSEPINENKVLMMLKLCELEQRKKQSGSNDSFWIDETKKLLRNLFELASSSKCGFDVVVLLNIVYSAPKTITEAESAEWKTDSFCAQTIAKIQEFGPPSKNAQLAITFFSERFPSQNDKTRSIIVGMVESIFDVLGRSPLTELFGATSNITPEQIIIDQKILVVDLPTKTKGDMGLYANVIWKYCFQKAVEKRSSGPPCFIWADEAQYFFNSDDFLFQTTARSSRCASVYLTQNYPNIENALGRSQAVSLTANLKTKIFHQNECPDTNEWASRLIGSGIREKRTDTSTHQTGTNVTNSQTSSTTTTRDRLVQPERFHSLKMGGEKNNGIVEGLLLTSGKVRHSIVRFVQSKNGMPPKAGETS